MQMRFHRRRYGTATRSPLAATPRVSQAMIEKLKPVVFTRHALERCGGRGPPKPGSLWRSAIGKREPAERGLWLYRLNLEYQREWDGKWYAVQQVAPVVDELTDQFVVITCIRFTSREKTNTMRITYDKEADALYIQLLEGDFQSRAVRVTGDISLDFAAGEQLVGIEVLGAAPSVERSRISAGRIETPPAPSGCLSF